jgi:uncharacterized Zn finger protein
MAWGRAKSRRVYSMWPKYVPVAERRAEAARAQTAHEKTTGKAMSPVRIDGRTIAESFWGKAWCTNLESYSDYSNRLPRGRTYVRNGSVFHLEIAKGAIHARVQGSSTYTVDIKVAELAPKMWKAIAHESAGEVESLIELLKGKIAKSVMEIVTRKETGLFPKPKQISLSCSCPDYATMCKHVAAVLYGVGARLDASPALLFTLRGVDPMDLVATATSARAAPKAARKGARILESTKLGDVFGIEIDEVPKARAKARAAAPPVAVAAKSGRPASKARAKARAAAPPVAVAAKSGRSAPKVRAKAVR